MTTVDPYSFAGPANQDEAVTFANAAAYEWGYLDTCRENSDAVQATGGDPALVHARPVPDGWAHAWLEYTRRTASRMAIREAFRQWRDTGSLPGLDSPARADRTGTA